MKRATRWVVLLLCVAISLGAILNVLVDNTEVEQMAKVVACEAMSAAPGVKPGAGAEAGPADCGMAKTFMSRSPIGQSFEFSGRNVTKRVTCRRSLIFVGGYSCSAD